MPSPSATKASDKQKACKKLTSLIEKDYGKGVPKFGMPVLETMLFAACLENNAWDAAKEGYERLNKLYYDLNEVRVSSVAEIEETLSDLNDANWAGLRIRSILRFVFESTYTYDYEKLKRLTQDSAQKRLKKIDHLSPFIRNFTVQHCLGGYLVPLDPASTRAAIHLGIVPPGSTEEQAGDFLKQGLKKAETFGFTCALRQLATDPRFMERLSEPPDEDEEFDVAGVETRFADLKKPKKRKKKKKPAPVKKAAAKKAPAKKKATASGGRKTAASKKTAGKSTTKKTAAKKTAVKKKSAARKATTSKSAAKKAPAKKKTAAKKAPAKKKAAAKKTTKKTVKKKRASKKK